MNISERFRLAAVTLACLFFLRGEALACPVCFNNAQGPLIDGAKLGVAAMIGVTVVVLVGFAAFFRRLAKLEKKAVAQAFNRPAEDQP